MGGARALGLEDKVGSLEVGKLADMIALDLSSVNTQPLSNIMSQLVYATTGSELTHSWIAGRCLVNEGRLTTLDLNTITARAGRWPEKFRTHQANH